MLALCRVHTQGCKIAYTVTTYVIYVSHNIRNTPRHLKHPAEVYRSHPTRKPLRHATACRIRHVHAYTRLHTRMHR